MTKKSQASNKPKSKKSDDKKKSMKILNHNKELKGLGVSIENPA